MSLKGVFYTQFNAAVSAGGISVPGLKVGDVAVSFTNSRRNNANDDAANYEGTVSVADQIQQLSSGTNGDVITGVFVRP